MEAEENSKTKALYQALIGNDDATVSEVKTLIAQGANVNALTATSQWTLLHDIAYTWNLEVAKLLIDH